MKRALVTFSIVIAALSLGSPALAGSQDVANEIASKVMSPFCDGVTLENCPSEEAVSLRAQIAHKAANGWSESRIMSWLRSQYGVEAAAPARSGVGLIAWLLPALAVLAGVGLLVMLLRRWTARKQVQPVTSPAIAPGDRARLDAELAKAREQS